MSDGLAGSRPAYDPEQRYAAGDTPNQHPGSPGLPQYQQDHQNLLNRDIVLWLTLGHHHVTRAPTGPHRGRRRCGPGGRPPALG